MSARKTEPVQELRRALVLLAGATAVIVAIEFIVVGLLPLLARDLALSLAETGHLAGAFALSAALLGPLLTLIVTSQPPRRVLAGVLLLFAAGNVAAVIFPYYPAMLAARIVQGAALPVFVSIGTATVTALAPPHDRGRALALANIGFVIGVVIALPAGVALAETGWWGPSFLALAAAALAAAIPTGAKFPVIVQYRPRWREQAALLRRPAFLSHLLLSVAVFAAVFAAYTYLAAWLEEVAGYGAAGVALTLAGFGAAGMIGNSLAGRFADQMPLRATIAVVLVIALAALLASKIQEPVAFYTLLAVWGTAHLAAITLCQIRVTLAGITAPAFAMAMNIASANLGIALGALAGGVLVEQWGILSIGWGVASLSTVVVGCAAVTAALDRHSSRATAGGCAARSHGACERVNDGSQAVD